MASEAPPVASGVARTVGALAAGLRSRGHSVDIVAASDSRRVAFGEIRLTAFGARLPALSRALSGFDVVDLHGPAPTVSDLFLLLRALSPACRRLPLVYTHHFQIDVPRLEVGCRVYNRLYEVGLRNVARIVVSSESYRGLLAQVGPPVSVVPWGIAYERYAADERRPRLDARLRVLFVGQMRAYKGIETLLAATDGDPRLALTVAGSGKLRSHFSRLAAECGHTARFLGSVAEARLPALYANHDVVVLPSHQRTEAYGLVLVEGSAAGCVPVASDLPGVRDVAAPRACSWSRETRPRCGARS